MKRWTFDNDELFDLVACGKKHGTCSLYSNDDSLSRVGDINIIYNSKNEQIKIRIKNVRKCRFCDVDEDWAKTEGEGVLLRKFSIVHTPTIQMRLFWSMTLIHLFHMRF